MQEPQPGSGSAARPTRTVARMIHLAVSGGLGVVFVVLLYLQTIQVPSLSYSAEIERVIRYIGYALLGGLILVGWSIRARIASPARGKDLNVWWAGSLTKALVLWALAEGVGLAGMALGWMSGDSTLLIAAVVVSFALLFVTRPGELERPV